MEVCSLVLTIHQMVLTLLLTHVGSAAAHVYDWPHIAMTYASLISLLLCKDYSFSRLSQTIRRNITHKFLPSLQDPSGGFKPVPDASCGEIDLRFVYCAVAICYLLDDFTGINRESCLRYIHSCKSYDGG